LRWKRYLVEVGTGIDLHGEDVTNAARKAVRDAITSHSMIGLRDICGFQSMEEINDALMVDVTIATPYPEKVNREEVLKVLPEGRTAIKVVEGGVRFPTPADREHASLGGIVVAVAVLVVLVDMDKVRTM
jgi:uncharacterized protein (TIGR02058 family)